MKRGVAFALVLVMLGSLCACSELDWIDGKVEGKGYDSPEAALLAYAEALKTGDVSEILSTFAIETYVENFNLEKELDRVGAYSPAFSIPIASTDAYTEGLNLVARQYTITKQLTTMYSRLALGDDYNGMPIAFNGDPYDDPDDLMDDLVMDDWMDTLSEMEIEEDDFLYLDDVYDDDRMDDNIKERCKALGCEELVSLAIPVTLDRDDYYICMDVACYDGVWYNCNQLSYLGAVLGAETNLAGFAPEELVEEMLD